MARAPNGHKYPWYGDAVWCRAYGNGQIVDVYPDEVIVVFYWWEGTLDNKEHHWQTETIIKEEFDTCWKSTDWGGYWRLAAYA